DAWCYRLCTQPRRRYMSGASVSPVTYTSAPTWIPHVIVQRRRGNRSSCPEVDEPGPLSAPPLL
ncbi:hypothetical protein NDU88_003663, partial [Pleurodeles waltl]